MVVGHRESRRRRQNFLFLKLWKSCGVVDYFLMFLGGRLLRLQPTLGLQFTRTFKSLKPF